MRNFRVLMLYPNGTLMNPPPISVGIFTALLKENGFEVDLFDSTLYPDPGKKSSDFAKQENLQVRSFDFGSRGVKLKESRLEDDLIKKIEEFRPDLVLISILECTYSVARLMLDVMENYKIPILAGGVFATFAPEIIFKNNRCVDLICMGEGEDALVKVCKRMATGQSCHDIHNICYKKDGKIIKNPYGPLVDINKLPIPDYSLFDEARFFRPMAGKVYKTIPLETNRGCPYFCTFCNSPATLKIYKDRDQKFFRKKSIEVQKKELYYLVEKWDAEYVYFTSDNFLVGSKEELDQFVEVYKEINLPFWMQSRPETVSEYSIRKLKGVGCHRISIGLEHGNEEFRVKVLKKTFDEKRLIKAAKIISDAHIPLTVNNIIGFPDETRDLVFDTIELNRKLTVDSTNCCVFAPFHGTPLKKVCVEKGYVEEDMICGSINTEAPLDMPQLSREEIKGLRRTFVLYVRMPKRYWPEIQRAEKFDEEGNRLFHKLREICLEQYMSADQTDDTKIEN